MSRTLPIVLVLFLTQAAMARQADLPPAFDEPFPMFTKALGDYSRTITTDNPETQAYFDQGIQMMYAFTTRDATRSFREAWKKDPECAICHWGEAWSWGSYLNSPMRSGDAILPSKCEWTKV